ncbi:MAG: hypothetical protein QME87_11615 [Bacillota bacterium]|nr:hypothetical protein [Bacillota bacterium]
MACAHEDYWVPRSPLVERYRHEWTRWSKWYRWLMEHFDELDLKTQQSLCRLAGPHRHWIDLPCQQILVTLTPGELGRLLLDLLGDEISGEDVAQFEEHWEPEEIRVDLLWIAGRESIPVVGFRTLLEEALRSSQQAAADSHLLSALIEGSAQWHECCMGIHGRVVKALTAAESFTRLLVQFLEAVTGMEAECSERARRRGSAWTPPWGQWINELGSDRRLPREVRSRDELRCLWTFVGDGCLGRFRGILEQLNDFRNKCFHPRDLIPGGILPCSVVNAAEKISDACLGLVNAADDAREMPVVGQLWFLRRDRYARISAAFRTELGYEEVRLGVESSRALAEDSSEFFLFPARRDSVGRWTLAECPIWVPKIPVEQGAGQSAGSSLFPGG